MSYILRSSLRYSLTNLCTRNNLFFRAAVPGFNKILSANYSLPSTEEKGNIAIDRLLKKLDQDARRMGRLSFRDVQEVIDAVETAQYVTVTQSLMLLRCFGNLMIEETPETRTSYANKLWKTLEDLGINVDISHYNALLRVYLENDHNFSPSDVLADLKEHKMEPNRVTFQRLISRYCQVGDLDGAFRILEHMNSKDMPVNVTVFNSLILGHAEKNDMENAVENIKVMKKAGLEPTSETYSILISGYIKQGNLEKADELMNQCESQDILFSEKDYFDIIYAYGMNGYESEIDKILHKMKKGANYNQEAINVIYRLVTNGKDEIAYKILKTLVRATRADGVVLPIGNFFITHLIRCEIPAEKIFHYCQELMKDNLNSRAMSVAMENSLRYGKEKCALELFKKAMKDGMTLRPHYFWPLLANRGRKGDKEGVLDMLSLMNKEYSVASNAETIREFVVPYLLQRAADIGSVIVDLKSCGISISTAVGAIVINLLQQKNLRQAAEIASLYRSYYPLYLIRKPLELSYLATRDMTSYITMLRELSLGYEWRSKSDNAKGDEDEIDIEGREYVGYALNDVFSVLMKYKNIKEITTILKAMVENGIGIGPNSVKYIKGTLGISITPEISSLIDKLVSDEYKVPSSTAKSSRLPVSIVDVKSLERLYETMEANGESTTTVRKQLFTQYGRMGDLEKLLELKQKFDQENFELTNGMWTLMINAYVENGKVDEALQLYDQVREKIPDFSLNKPKMLKLALLLVQNDQVDRAYELLQTKPAEIVREEDDFNFTGTGACVKLLNVFAEKGDVANVKKFLDLVISKELIEVTNGVLGPLIKAHLRNDDVDGAMTEFAACCEKYRFTPFKGELTRIFIEKEDAPSLQRITDLTTEIHGEANALYDLAFAFMENGRMRQAKKIIDTPGLRIRYDRIRSYGEKYQNEGAIQNLENLLKLTQNMMSVNRSELYDQLLMTYDKANDHKKSLSLWMELQEDDAQPSDEFLVRLANILERNGLAVPFTVPDNIVKSKPTLREHRAQNSRSSQSIRRLLGLNKLDEALKVKETLKPEQMSRTDMSLLIEACVRENRYECAVQLMNELKALGELPHERILKYFLMLASNRGDYEFISSLGHMIPKEIRQHVKFNTKHFLAIVNAGKVQEYLNDLERRLDNVQNDDDLDKFLNDFPRGGIGQLMIDNPELTPKIMALLKKIKSKNETSKLPDNIMWAYYMITKQFDEAKKLWDSTYASSEEVIPFRHVSGHVKKTADIEVGKLLCNMIENKSKMGDGAIGLARSALIAAYVRNNLVEEALETLKEGLKKIDIEYFIRQDLATLKAACAAKNIDFPYTVPDRASVIRRLRSRDNKSDSGDSSDSD